MIISHRYRYIFLKTNKTAGTSVEIALSAFCGEDDVITPISPPDEAIRRELGHRGPQHADGFYHHMPAIEVRERIGEDVWCAYFKFCIERNPWDRVLSLYYYRNRREPRPPLSAFLDSGQVGILTERGIDLYTIDGELAVDYVYRYEDLDTDLARLAERLGLPGSLELPRAKSGYRRDHRPYREIIDPACRERIAVQFAREIELFGYTF